MATTTTAAERAEISRRNGAKSKGPRSAEGKERSKFNALKHGMTAKTLILPGEDAGVYQARLGDWLTALEPANDAQESLVENAVGLTWLLDRAHRAENARLSFLIRNQEANDGLRQQAEAAALSRRLLFDLRRSCARYSEIERIRECRSLPRRPATGSALEADPDPPAAIVLQLECTPAGSQRLL